MFVEITYDKIAAKFRVKIKSDMGMKKEIDIYADYKDYEVYYIKDVNKIFEIIEKKIQEAKEFDRAISEIIEKLKQKEYVVIQTA